MRYAELHCKTNFSFLEGASHARELAARAAELDYFALAVTDRESLAGVVRAHQAAQEVGLQLLIGAEIHPSDAPPVLLWASDRASYGRLCRLLTVGRRRAGKGECELSFDDLAAHQEGLLAGCLPPLGDPGHGRDVSTEARRFQPYRELFGDRGSLLAELHYGPDDRHRLDQLRRLAREVGLPLAAAGDVHYHAPERLLLHDVLTAIRLGTTVDQLGKSRFGNAQRHLRPLPVLRQLYADVPEALERTIQISQACRFSLDSLRYEYPEELAPDGQSPMAYLRELTWQGAQWRYPGCVPSKVCQALDHELALIEELGYEAYFLTVWDIVRFARNRGILCQGRGSAANSAVCYCLGVTSVDPNQTDLLFERFISRERNEAPDIDVDFEHERREEVLQYLYGKYGRDRAGMTAEVITYRLRSAIRDAGKALGMSLDCVDAVAKNVEGYASDDRLAERFQQVGVDPTQDPGRRWLEVSQTLVGFPRHLSQHVGGMVMTRGPLCELVPIENAAMADRTVICWDKDDLDTLGILKVDCLALGMLTAIRKCFQIIANRMGQHWTLANIPPEDPDTYAMICRADTIGVFQIESRAQMSMLPRLRPRCYYDLVIEVAIVRPGPIQGQMVHPYLRRRGGLEPVSYASPAIREVLEKTLGVPIFQEQAMRLAVVAAGFSPGEADQLRRAMGAWRKTGVLDQFRVRLIEGMRSRGLSQEFAEQLFRQIRGFGEYGFPESHAASFALLVYVSAWLKCHYPACFLAAMLNSQPLGFYASAQLIRDAREHGVMVLPIDVNESDWDHRVEPRTEPIDPASDLPSGDAASWAVRLGFRELAGFSEPWARRIVAAREAGGRFQHQGEFARRTGSGQATMALLANADAFASLGKNRRQALWDALAQNPRADQAPLFAGLEDAEEPLACLPPLPALQDVLTDYTTAGFSLKAHPISHFRAHLCEKGAIAASELVQRRHGTVLRVGGLVILRQRPATAKGITFVTLEDETGTINLVLHPATWNRYYRIARRSPAWVAKGRLERKQGIVHLVTSELADLAEFLGKTASIHGAGSRDFR